MRCEYKAIFRIMDSMQPAYRERTLPFIFCAGLLFLFMPVLGFMLSSLGFVAGISISPVHLPVVFVCTALFVYTAAKKYFGQAQIKPFLAAISVFIVVSVVGAWHLNQVFDTSYDGIWYHQEAVIHFSKGWNPYYRMLLPEEGSPYGPFYDNHYPKSAWIAEGMVYAFTQQLESSKVVNLWMMTGLLFTSLFALLHLKTIPYWGAVLFSVLIGFNPVSVYQLYAFYVDGQLGAGLMAMIILLAASALLKNRLLFGLAAAVFIYIANIKFTGLVYACFMMVFYLVYICWKKRAAFKFAFIAVAVTGLAAVLLWGYPTYVTNTINNHHPLYPIMGPDSRGDEIAAVPQSANFKDKGRLQKFWLATYAEPMWCRAPLESTPKKLFRPVSDKYYFTRADFEMSGFGPFYAELFLFILAGALLVLVLPVTHKAEWLFAAVAVVAVSFLNSEVWYARYVPQLWLFAIIVIMALWHHRYLKYFGIALSLGLLFNNLTLAKYYAIPHILESREVHCQIRALKALNRPVLIITSWPLTFGTKAKELGLPYIAPPAGFQESDYAQFYGFNTRWGLYNTAELEEAKKLLGDAYNRLQ